MTKEEVRARIHEIGIIPAVRLHSPEDAIFAAEAVASGGIPIVEVTITVPGALDVIRHLSEDRLDVIQGAGTVLDLSWARRCVDAGALFITSPGFDVKIVEFAANEKILVIPGALTPTDIIAAAKAGADFVKIFPCAQIGGPGYIKALKSPFPEVPFIASGGVNQQNASEYILAGAAALGIGRDLIHEDAIKRRDHGWIRELARRYRSMVTQARAQLNPH
ncbi:MAG: bifunctional 4-hydroxy-2-oxoglutarate aldolase/2-dehydro-3-deoxy-phosphogluconate aldolase [Bryobacteraceae bacterium]|jgi:2-dehydro-3-deoxyphosphogluconate aldolase/(4S)-4-hydroxy-2-oxoglutarate aldolase